MNLISFSGDRFFSLFFNMFLLNLLKKYFKLSNFIYFLMPHRSRLELSFPTLVDKINGLLLYCTIILIPRAFIPLPARFL